MNLDAVPFHLRTHPTIKERNMRDEDEGTVTAEAPPAEVTQPESSTGESATQAENLETPASTEGEKAPELTDEEKAAAEKAAAEKAAAEEKAAEEAFEKFKAAVTEAVNQRDEQTGTVPAQFVAPVKTAYAELPNNALKKRARDLLADAMKDALRKELNASKAKAYMDLEAEVKTTSATRETVIKPPVDPTQAHVEKVASFYLAVSMIVPGEGVDANWTQKVQALSQSLAPEVKAWQAYETDLAKWEGDRKENETDEAYNARQPKAPEVSQVVLNAAKIAKGRGTRAAAPRAPRATSGTSTRTSGTPYSGPRRDVKKHIAEVFANKPVGTFIKTGAIAKFNSSEYPDGDASSGAVTSALNSPKFNVPGIVPATESGISGAKKIS